MPAATDTTRPATGRDSADWRSLAVLAHAVPFVCWIVLRLLLDRIAPGQAWPYAVQTVAGAALLLVLRPWRFYPGPSLRSLVPGVAAGVLVLAFWVVPFLGLGEGMPLIQELYLRFCVLPLGRLPSMPDHSIYAPEVCGWPLTLMRLAGSALVIAVAEEFFWRGFLYRRLVRRDFLSMPLGQYDRQAFWLSALIFGLEHREVVAGILAGAVFGAVMLRTRDLWSAVLAHVVTNLLLGIYVIAAGAYGFW